MKQLQVWFNRIAGVCNEEQERLAVARAIFAERGPDLAALATPACWRRNRPVWCGWSGRRR